MSIFTSVYFVSFSSRVMVLVAMCMSGDARERERGLRVISQGTEQEMGDQGPGAIPRHMRVITDWGGLRGCSG